DDLDKRYPETNPTEISQFNMDLREPIEPLFRIAQMGLGYDEDRNMIVLVAQELVITDEDVDPDTIEPGIVRMWSNRAQMRALSIHSTTTVQAGRPDPKLNGRIAYYWT